MSRHSTSFEAERSVPAETARELLPGPSHANEVAIPTPKIAKRGTLRRLLMAGTAVAVLAAASWYGFHYWTVGRFLVSTEDMRSLLAKCGFIAELFEDTSNTHLSRTISNATPAAAGQLGLAVFVNNLGEKAANARRSLLPLLAFAQPTAPPSVAQRLTSGLIELEF